MKHTFTFFDFDGTIIKGDSLISFGIFVHGRAGFLWKLIIECIWILKCELGIISNSRAKEHLFSRLYKGMDYSVFKDYCVRYAKEIDNNLRNDIMSLLNAHREQGHQVVIVSASLRERIEPWAKTHGIEKIIATEVEIDINGKLTGRFASPNCHGKEKVRRIREFLKDFDNCETYAYGDSKSDQHMLDFADHGFLVKR